jgi:hypothetical protein
MVQAAAAVLTEGRREPQARLAPQNRNTTRSLNFGSYHTKEYDTQGGASVWHGGPYKPLLLLTYWGKVWISKFAAEQLANTRTNVRPWPARVAVIVS